MPKQIAFFDFDGTITTRDTMLELARFKKGTAGYWLGMLRISPWLIAMKAGLISKTKAKEKFLHCFFKDETTEAFQTTCRVFAEQIIPKLIRQDALAAIRKHQQENTEVVVVSASAENWVAPWCQVNQLQYICTRLEFANDKITGRLNGTNCNGPEKVSRIKEIFDTADYDIIYCYGDSSGDKEMLQLSTVTPGYRLFKK